VRSLDSRHVEKARGAADQRTAWKYELRDRLQAAFVDCPRAVRQSLRAFERAAYGRMGLETLELVVRGQMWILVAQVDDESHRDEILAEVVEKDPPPVLESSGQPWL
jgi:hypothetical protein